MKPEPLKGKKDKGIYWEKASVVAGTLTDVKIIHKDILFSEKDIRAAVEWLIEMLWKDKAGFEGIKCKTCLPVDYVVAYITEAFEDVID